MGGPQQPLTSAQELHRADARHRDKLGAWWPICTYFCTYRLFDGAHW